MLLARRLARRLPPTPIALALLTLLVAAFALRVYGLDWDDGQYLHPDERHVVDVLSGRIFLDWPPSLSQVLDPATSGLNPRSADPESGEFRPFAYGALPLLITNAVAAVISLWSDRDWDGYGSAHLIGRSLSAILDTLTVLAVFALGHRLFGRRVALLGAAFAALTPMSIQLAHFFTTDSWLTFFVAACLLAAAIAAERGEVRWFAVTGACFGLAMATKGSVFTLAGVIAAAAAYDLWRRTRAGPGRWWEALPRSAFQVGIAGAVSVGAFALFEPYALFRPDVYLDSLIEQAEIVSGRFDVPYTRQYVGTTPVWYQLEQFVKWGFGPVAGLLALVGVPLLARRFWRDRTAGQWIVLTWLFGYGLVVAVAEAKFLRYLAPLVPVLAIMAGLAVDAVWRFVDRRVGRKAGGTAAAALLLGAAVWTLAFASIYAHEPTRLAASRWILANVPSGSALSDDYWDDALPLVLGPGLTGVERQHDTVTIDLYADRPPSEAADEIFSLLNRVDYVVLSSNRVEAAMPQSPWRYPVQGRYYELLRTERLGFERVAEFARTPALGPIRFVDHDADESWINYDHPRVSIYQKVRPLARAEFDRLMTPALERPWSPTRQAPETERRSLLLDEPVGALAAIDDARWSAALTANSAAALVVWLLFLVVLQVVGWPLASLLFGRFADAGWGFGRLAAFLVSGYLVWIGASVELIAFRAVWVVAAILAVGVLGWTAWRLHRGVGGLWRFTAAQRRTALGAEAVFWGVFGLFLLFRYLNPDGWHPFWGGEKPMEFAHLNATLRSAHFPPYDPWYADGYINYYYYGLYLVAFCLKATGIPSEIGFNLAQPTMMALLGSAGYAVAATLGRDIARRRGAAIGAGLLGTLLVVGVGNLVPLREVLSGATGGDAFDRWVWGPSRAILPNITEFPFFTGLYADLHAHVVALPITVLVIGLAYAVAGDRAGVAAALARRGGEARSVLVSRLAMLALCLGTLTATNAWDVPVYAALAVVAIAVGTGSVAGVAFRGLVTLGLALFLGVASIALFAPFLQRYVALFGSLAAVREPTPFGQVVSHLGGLATIVVVGLVVTLLPTRSVRAAVLLHPLVVVAVIGGLFAGRTIVGTDDPDLAGALGAAVVLVAIAVLAAAVWLAIGTAAGPAAGDRRAFARGGAVALAFAVLTLILATDRVVLAGFLALVGAGAALWLCGDRGAARYVGLLVAAAASIGAGTEVVVLADDLIGSDWYRMNTVFKFYNQIWVLMALAAAALASRMVSEVFPGEAPRPASWEQRLDTLGVSQGGAGRRRWTGPHEGRAPLPSDRLRVEWARAGLVLTGLAVTASLLYPVLAIRPRLEQRFVADLGSGTLNALDWMEYGSLPVIGGDDPGDLSFAGDRAAIDWFNRNVAGSPVVAEASIGPYRCNGSRISIGTGLPTIIGWERHQQQQRYPETLGGRVADVRRLYDSPDPSEKLDIMARYDVAYVVVGPLERLGIRIDGNDCVASPEPAGIAALQAMVGTDLDVAFAGGGTTVYRVRSTA